MKGWSFYLLGKTVGRTDLDGGKSVQLWVILIKVSVKTTRWAADWVLVRICLESTGAVQHRLTNVPLTTLTAIAQQL